MFVICGYLNCIYKANHIFPYYPSIKKEFKTDQLNGHHVRTLDFSMLKFGVDIWCLIQALSIRATDDGLLPETIV